MLKSIQLLAHSGFLFELPEAFLVFDYFQDPAQVLTCLTHTTKPVLFFSTHYHHDHWNPEILDFPQKYALNEVHYILDHSCFAFSRENIQTRLHEMALAKQVTFVQPGDVVANPNFAQYGLKQIRITGSTDAGSSLNLLTHADELIFFAGDLNDWDWQDEESLKMHEAFVAELQKLRQSLTFLARREDFKVDWVLAPLDKRLGEKAEQGPLQFIEALKPRHFIPMHLMEGYELPALLQEKTEIDVVQSLLHPGDRLLPLPYHV